MRDPEHAPSRDIQVTDASGHASFILRCWAAPGQPVRVRIVDVNTGVSHPVADLNTLPAFLRELIAEQPPDKE